MPLPLPDMFFVRFAAAATHDNLSFFVRPLDERTVWVHGCADCYGMKGDMEWSYNEVSGRFASFRYSVFSRHAASRSTLRGRLVDRHGVGGRHACARAFTLLNDLHEPAKLLPARGNTC